MYKIELTSEDLVRIKFALITEAIYYNDLANKEPNIGVKKAFLEQVRLTHELLDKIRNIPF